jgi:hypothetical protein
MFSLFVLILFVFSPFGVSQGITAVKDAVPFSPPDFSIQIANQPLNSCGGENIEDIVNAGDLSEIILWRVGTLAVQDKEISCRVHALLKV